MKCQVVLDYNIRMQLKSLKKFILVIILTLSSSIMYGCGNKGPLIPPNSVIIFSTNIEASNYNEDILFYNIDIAESQNQLKRRFIYRMQLLRI